jgi:fructose-1-phosphate kinase PfkB-like protein
VDLEEDVRQAREVQAFAERELAAAREKPAPVARASSSPDGVEERIRADLIQMLHDKSQEVSAESPALSRGLRQAEMLLKKGEI